ncbi:hypothetical protein APUTEX25_000361 [Auxenochlorella protothecoides]|uniref:UBC core domain-containing protein n=1 Tax=Auxenochlorella protothecoides TaxID=3075 RepID=A0A3M7KYE9_AUXPR|nr:hypothetical protein APUTEX25_000361 [Auxenochlorella protothecoides]|eukprot:RMZ54844.1 hypothetical protein APUTEX25_000361 [Auxenochlorella protothecoides]
MNSAASLRLLSDLKAISREPPDGCSASPIAEDNLYVWVSRSDPLASRRHALWLHRLHAPPHLSPTPTERHHLGASRYPLVGIVHGCHGLAHLTSSVWEINTALSHDACREGGVFQLRLTFGDRYPDLPPRVRFTSEIYHPNVYADGTLCMDIIQDQWSPCHSVCSILTSVQSLLTDPNPQSPANPEAAQLLTHHLADYNKRVRRIAQKSTEE